MRKEKKQRLEAAGWKVGSAEEFLELTPGESAFIQVKLALAGELKKIRIGRKLTQAQVAKALKSSQSRVAKMEAADPSVSLDLLIRSLLVLGASPQRVGKAIAAD